MKVLYDHQTFILQKYGGISRYFSNLYESLNNNSGIECELSLLYSQNHYIGKKSYLSDKLGKQFLKKYKRLDKWNKKYSEYIISKNNYDVFHPTYYDPYFLGKLKKPFVITVHDMIHELYPEWFAGYDQYVRYKRLVFERADHFIAISQATKNDLQSIYNIDDSKISVVHHGYRISEFSRTSFLPPFKNYILYVGDRSTYKNFNRFVNAVTDIIHIYPDICLICAGGGSFSVVEQELLIRKKLKNVIQVSANDEQLKVLYEKALLFVYPSLCEGFGLPILEAFANKCPAVISNIPCFKEVGGDACVYFDPNDTEAIFHTIQKIIKHPSFAEQLKEKGEIQLHKFSIDTCVSKTAKVYETLC